MLRFPSFGQRVIAARKFLWDCRLAATVPYSSLPGLTRAVATHSFVVPRRRGPITTVVMIWQTDSRVAGTVRIAAAGVYGSPLSRGRRRSACDTLRNFQIQISNSHDSTSSRRRASL